jgi:prepilin-type N-terminal cleavage/methylation domain-containing protein
MQEPRLQKGFSLIEMLIYVSIVSVFMVVVVQVVLGIVDQYSYLRLARNIENSATVSLDRLIREIRAAESIDMAQSIFNANPGRLVLSKRLADGTLTTVDFYIATGTLNLKEGGAYSGPLTASTTSITNLIFGVLSTTTSKAIKIDMELTSTQKEITKTGIFHSTVVVRGTY